MLDLRLMYGVVEWSFMHFFVELFHLMMRIFPTCSKRSRWERTYVDYFYHATFFWDLISLPLVTCFREVSTLFRVIYLLWPGIWSQECLLSSLWRESQFVKFESIHGSSFAFLVIWRCLHQTRHSKPKWYILLHLSGYAAIVWLHSTFSNCVY